MFDNQKNSNRLFKINTLYQRVLACSLLFLVGLPTGVLAQQILDDPDVTAKIESTPNAVYSVNDQVNWYDFERYDVLSGKINFYVEDMRIEGNGMPIIIARQHKWDVQLGLSGIGNIGLAVPKIEFLSLGGGDFFKSDTSISINNGIRTRWKANAIAERSCTGLQLAYRVGPSAGTANVRNLRSNIKFTDGNRTASFFPRNESPGDVSRFPPDAAYVSPDNWYITCDGTDFNVHTNDGTTYTMSNWYQRTGDYRITRNRSFVSKVTDVHGNSINYNFVDPGRPVLGDKYTKAEVNRFTKPKLESIVASDDRKVMINYGSGYYEFSIARIYDNSGSDYNNSGQQRYVRYRLQNGLRVTFEDNSEEIYIWTQPYPFFENEVVMDSVQLRGGGVIKYEHAQIPHATSDYIDKWNPRFERNYRLLKRTLHTSKDSQAVVEHDFGWHAVDGETISRTISSASNTVEYRLKKIYPNAIVENQLPLEQLPYTRIKDSGRLVEFKNFGRKISDGLWNADLIPEVRKNYKWIELGKVVDYNSVLRRYPKHPGFATYYESIVAAPEEITTTLKSATSDLIFKTENKSFDDYGRPTETEEKSNDGLTRTTTTQYRNTSIPWVNGLVLRSEVEDGSLVINQHYQNGLVLRSTVNGIATDYTYSGQGNLETVKNAEGHVQRYDDYFRGIPRKETDANGYVTSRGVNSDGALSWETVKGSTQKTKYDLYDSSRRIERIISPEGRITTFTHTPTSMRRLTAAKVSRVITDGLGREVFKGESAGVPLIVWSSVLTRYDADGRVAFRSYPWDREPSEIENLDTIGLGVHYSYDALGRVIEEDQVNLDRYNIGDISYRYNTNGLSTTVIDGSGKSTLSKYRSFGSPSEPVLIQTTSPSGVVTDMRRHLDGRIKQINRNGLLRTYQYDNQLRLEKETHPETGSISYTYWGDGELKTRTNRLDKTTYNYDGHNRLRKESTNGFNGGLLERVYDYRNNDLLKWVSNTSTGYSPSQATQTAYEYDWDGNLTSETLVVDDQQMNMTYEYDWLGALKSVRYPTGRRYDLNPNDFGRPTKIVDDAGKTVYSEIKFHPNGKLRQIKRPNLVFDELLYRTLYPALTTTVAKNVLQAKQLYSYTPNLNVSSIEGVNANEYQAFDYDDSSRLIKAKSGLFGNREYEYDEHDNIDWTTHNGVLTDYEYASSSNRLTGMKTAGVERMIINDSRGNIAGTGKLYLTYNAANQVLTSRAITNNNDVTSYVYDGQGRRVKTLNGGKTVYQMYDQSGKLRYRSEPARNLQSEYLYVNNKLVARRDSDDGQGSEYGEIFRDDFNGDSVSSNFFVPTWAIGGRAAVNNINSCSQSGGYLSLAIKNVGNESQACYLISNKGDLGPGDDSTLKVDFHANVSGVKAQGAWFAGWIYPVGLNPDGSHPAEDNDPTTGNEFDVFEYMPTWDTAYNTAIHDGGTEQQWIYGDLLNGIDLTADQFHTYSMEWNKDCVVFSIDGIPVRASTSPLISGAKKHAIYLTMEAQTGKQWDFWDVGDFKQNLDANPTVGKIDWVSVTRTAGVDPNLCDGAPPSDPPTDPPPGDTTPWGPPQNLSASADSDSQISLSWSPVDTAIKYNVYRDDQYIDTVTGQTNYADSGLATGTTYSYYVTAIRDTTADQFSGKSASTSATTTGDINDPPTDGTAWGPPQNLVATAQSDSQISLSWRPVDTAIKYNVYRNDEYIDTVTGATTYTDSGLAEGTTYSYYTTAIRDTATDQFSGKSTLASATTTGGTNPPPNDPPPSGTTPWGAPQNLSASSQSDSQISLSWSPVDTAIKYNVYRNDQYIDTVTGATTYTDSGLAAGTTYSYYATAIRDTTSDQFSGKSASASATTSGSTPPNSGQNPTPPVLSGQDYSSSAIEITWTASSDSDGAVVEYEVVRTSNGQNITHRTNGRSWWQDDLSANTEYTYSVKAVDNDGNRSANSNVITVRTRP